MDPTTSAFHLDPGAFFAQKRHIRLAWDHCKPSRLSSYLGILRFRWPGYNKSTPSRGDGRSEPRQELTVAACLQPPTDTAAHQPSFGGALVGRPRGDAVLFLSCRCS